MTKQHILPEPLNLRPDPHLQGSGIHPLIMLDELSQNIILFSQATYLKPESSLNAVTPPKHNPQQKEQAF